MMLLKCPNCGQRNVSEFHFGGELTPRPVVPEAADETEWTKYLYMRANRSGMQTEWWYHRSGCGLWFLADRDWASNAVLRTYEWAPAGDPAGSDG